MSAQIASSLDKSLALLFAFADPDSADQRIFTVSELAARQGLDKSQVSRILATFAKYGLIERLEKRRGYQLGWSLVHLASRALTAQTMSSVYPALTGLASETQETVYLAIRDGAYSTTLATFEPHRRLYVSVPEGQRDSLIGSAVGYATLSRSDRADIRAVFDSTPRHERRTAGRWQDVVEQIASVRRLGYSVIADERSERVTTIAAPIIDVGNYSDRVYAVVAISAPDERADGELDRLVERLVEVATSATQYLRNMHDGHDTRQTATAVSA